MNHFKRTTPCPTTPNTPTSFSDPLLATELSASIGNSALTGTALPNVTPFLHNISPADRDFFFGQPPTNEERKNGGELANMLLEWTNNVPFSDFAEENRTNDNIISLDSEDRRCLTAEELLMMERRTRAAFEMYRNQFPTSVWSCCKRQCFTNIAIDPQKLPSLRELRVIHSVAEEIHEDIKRAGEEPETRRKGVGGSTVAFVAPSREQRERMEGIVAGTDRKRELQRLAKFVLEVLPFLRGQQDVSGCGKDPPLKLCTKTICDLLGVSRSFLYYMRKKSAPSDKPNDYELASIVDTANVRLRQHRRNGDRTGYPAIPDLPSYHCGCEEPCFAGLKTTYFQNEYNAFSSCASSLNPRRKENLYLLNVMFSTLTNSPVRHCDNALSALYTVSKGYIANVRSVLQQMCDDDSVDHRRFLKEGMTGYRMDNRHPIYRYGAAIREKIEKHLDFVLRADPAGADGSSVCRVYSPEINTKEKLRKSIAEALESDEDVEDHLSESTLQRMVNKYLKERNCTVSFSQNDHNACPTCKAQKYASLQYWHEAKKLERQYKAEFGNVGLNMDDETRSKSEELKALISAKRFQEKQSLDEFEAHVLRDKHIRKAIKKWSDHFRNVERFYLRKWRKAEHQRLSRWNSLHDHAIITHQDDMTKVDLPHFRVTASADITRWRYDVNAHVSSVNDECVVFSHEQGTGPKNAGSICEMVLLDHLIRCKGEGIKVVVSDNASVGKNWITTIALPQYMVDQGLADIVFVVFLENNHGKWLADMLFGQMQTRRRRTTLLSVDDLLEEFEAVRRRSGKVQGFAVNPLSSIDFAAIFESLGYQTKPSKDFGFVKRNIHFAAACRQSAKEALSPEIKELFGSGLPCHEGMVRISSSPPTNKRQDELPYEERYFDVPAARLSTQSRTNDEDGATSRSEESQHSEGPLLRDLLQPLVVPFDQKFKESGHNVVPQRTAQHVGHNGFVFRNAKGYPELNDSSSKLVRQAWPLAMIKPFGTGQSSDPEEPLYGVESKKCAPENWVVREPVGHFGGSEWNWKARYPPRNVLNGHFGKGPRVEEPWVPTKTYNEPPFPINENTAAAHAMRRICGRFTDISKSVTVLDLLREVFECMGDRGGISDPWLQQRATVASREAQMKYRDELRLFADRNEGEPRPVKTVRQLFKEDDEVKNRVEYLLSQQGSGKPAKGAKT